MNVQDLIKAVEAGRQHTAVDLLSYEVVEAAGREWWAQTRDTDGPRVLRVYASREIMDDVHNTARIIITEAIKAARNIKEIK